MALSVSTLMIYDRPGVYGPVDTAFLDGAPRTAWTISEDSMIPWTFVHL